MSKTLALPLNTLLLSTVGFFFVAAMVLSGTVVHAADDKEVIGTSPAKEMVGTSPSNSPSITLKNPLKVDSLEGLLNIVLDAVIKLGEIVLTLAIIWTGFKFVAARGNPEAIKGARSALIWTIIGGLILLGAKGIETLVFSTVNSL